MSLFRTLLLWVLCQHPFPQPCLSTGRSGSRSDLGHWGSQSQQYNHQAANHRPWSLLAKSQPLAAPHWGERRPRQNQVNTAAPGPPNQQNFSGILSLCENRRHSKHHLLLGPLNKTTSLLVVE